LHDAVAAERLGVPALAVMTTQFVSAAELMSRVLGLPEYEFAIIDHPVSSATDARLAEFARTAMTQGEGLLLQN
tara:strand:+ start:11063 stop:11284 length:222 start_codon:yes stop_codon:yes gene_type:complete